MSPDREQADLLLRKAAEDQAVLSALAGNHEIADSALGFHAQQAVEKAIKAVLAARSDDFPWTHDLQLLIRRVEQLGIDVPQYLRDARRLTPWAVEFRYGDTLDEPLDRAPTLNIVSAVLAWAGAEVASS